jgi:hypothetical protein
LAALAAHRNAPLSQVLPNNAPGSVAASASLPQVPAGWNSLNMAKGGEMKFRTANGTTDPGQASLAVVALSRPTPSYDCFPESQLLTCVASLSTRCSRPVVG